MTREEAIKMLNYLATDTTGTLAAHDGEYAEFLVRVIDALDMAIAALREQERVAEVGKTSGWISVEERLPTPYQNVIVWRDNYLDNSGCVDIDFTFVFNDGEVEWADHMRTWKSVVTHWMPLPEPPEEDA